MNSSFNSNKHIKRDSQNIIYKLKFDVLSNGAEIIKKYERECGIFQL
jgi:hypothetical protein